MRKPLSRCLSLLSRCVPVVLGALSLAISPAPALALETEGGGQASCPNAALRGGASAHLPDCRAYEQVSPVEKVGTDAFPGTDFVFPVQASVNGGALAYMSFAAFSGAQSGEMPNAYVASRGPSGWQTSDVAPPTPQPTPYGAHFLGYDFSADLSRVVIKLPFQTLTPAATPGIENLYLRGSEGAYSLVTAGTPSELPAPGCGNCWEAEDLVAFSGANSGTAAVAPFSHVLFEATDNLTPGAPSGGVGNLYENVGGQVRLVSMLPDGAIAASGATAGAGISPYYSEEASHAGSSVAHAISADGSHVLFQATADGGAPDPPQSGLTELYDRMNGSTTIEVSAPAPLASPANPAPAPARFWTASTDGSLVFFTSAAELTTQSNTGVSNEGSDLYRYDTRTGSLTDLTVDPEGAGAGVMGVVGASEDGSYVYFVAAGRLLSGKGSIGQPNLYVSHDGVAEFIATLGEEDSSDWTPTPAESRAYVTPDGRHLAFMSKNSLTGYDNNDQSTGAADSEVYEYSAAEGSLVCASCDPNGARPLGSAFVGLQLSGTASTPFYQPRVLSDDGSRLFFSSPDPLALGVGAHVNVFEYEVSAIHLISGGGSSEDDMFLDADPSGKDVFFATRERLLPGDKDDDVDVYDAREDGGLTTAASLAPCAGSACQSQAGASLSLSAPTSATFTGAGNLATPSKPQAAKSNKSKAKKGQSQRKSRKRKRVPEHRSKSRRRGKARLHAVVLNHHRSR
jgi:hypothetical protein